MEKSTVRFSILGIMLLAASAVQFFDVTIWGVVPNFILTVIVVAALLLHDFGHELLLLSLASFLLKVSPVVNRETLVFFGVGLALISIERKLPWHTLVNGIFLIAFSTTLLYVLIDKASLPSLMFVKELGYNVLLMYALYYGLTSFRLFRHR